MKPVIIIAIAVVCSVAIFSILPNAEAKQTTKLTFGGLHSTYTIGEAGRGRLFLDHGSRG